MVLAVPQMPSCARAWVAAAEAVVKGGDEAYDLIIDVADPTAFDERDHAVVRLVEGFLRGYKQYPISTIVNTRRWPGWRWPGCPERSFRGRKPFRTPVAPVNAEGDAALAAELWWGRRGFGTLPNGQGRQPDHRAGLGHGPAAQRRSTGAGAQGVAGVHDPRSAC
jgi:hypothetical protein